MRHVIVGASAAGLAAAESILTVDPGAEIVLLSEERDRPYCRPMIAYWLAEKSTESLLPLPFPVLSRIDLRLGCQAVGLDPEKKHVRLESGETVGYDRLCLATGASPKPLNLAGEELPNVLDFRTRRHAEGVSAEISRGAQRAVVLGGGLMGIKAAHALAARGLRVTLVEREHLLAHVADFRAGQLIADALTHEGVEVLTHTQPVAIENQQAKATGVVLDPPGKPVQCDLLLRTVGVVPRVRLVGGFGFDTTEGIPTDETLRTPLYDVWAAGDVALTRDVAWGCCRVNAIWPMATEQGALAGRNMAGAEESYGGSLGMNSIRIGNLHLIAAGVARPPDPYYEERFLFDRAHGRYRKVVIRDGRLVGMTFAGDPEQAGVIISAIRKGARVEDLPLDPLEQGMHWGRHAFAAGTSGGNLGSAYSSLPAC